MNVGGIAASVLLHAGLFTVITRTHAPVPVHQKTVISITERKKEPEQKKPDPKPAVDTPAIVEPVKAPEPPKPKPQPKATPAPKSEPAPEGDGNAAPPASGAPALDLGNMTFTNDSGNGVAISPDSLGRDPNAEPAQPKPKAKPRAAEKSDPDKLKPKGDGADCSEELVKPKAVSKVPIDYPAAAREQGIEGQLVLRVHVGADGKVGEVEVVKSAGALIDEPAIASLKSWTFEPATKCGKPVESTYTVSRRFELGT